MLSINKMDLEKKKILLIKKKLFTFSLVITIPWNFKNCSRTKIFRCKLRVKSSITNVNSHIPLFSFISNYEHGQNRIIQSLKPTRILNPVNKHMFKVNNTNIREICSRLTIKIPERRHWRRSGGFIVKFEYISHFFLVCLMMTLNTYLFPGRDRIKSLHKAVFTVNNSSGTSNRMPVNFIKLLHWNITKQLKESVIN